jgi:hypothetical protein
MAGLLLFPEYLRMKFPAAILLALLLCTAAKADEVDLSFNSDAFRVFYIHDFANNDLQSDFGLLIGDDGWVANTSLYLTGFASDGTNPLQASIGGRTGYVSGDKSGQDGAPLALGGAIKFSFPGMNRLNIGAALWYAPDVLTLGDLDTYQDYSLRVGYSVMQQADLYVGYRYVESSFDNGTKAKFDDGFNLGFSIRF